MAQSSIMIARIGTCCGVYGIAHLPVVNFIGLNPSIADEYTNDPTIRRCIGFAKSLGAGGIVMTNLFSFRTPNPKMLPPLVHLEGSWIVNRSHIATEARKAAIVIAAWGNLSSKRAYRVACVIALTAWEGVPLLCLRRNADGSPAHPLYLPNGLTPIAFEMP